MLHTTSIISVNMETEARLFQGSKKRQKKKNPVCNHSMENDTGFPASLVTGWKICGTTSPLLGYIF